VGRWSNLATHPTTKSIKPRPNRAQSSLIVPNRAIFPCLDMATDRKTAKFRNWQLPGPVRSDRSDRSVLSGNPLLAAPSCRAQASAKAEALVKVEIRNPQSAIAPPLVVLLPRHHNNST